MIANGTLTGGMIPKITACLDALDGGVHSAHLLDGRTRHVLLVELFTDSGIGTMIVPDAGANDMTTGGRARRGDGCARGTRCVPVDAHLSDPDRAVRSGQWHRALGSRRPAVPRLPGRSGRGVARSRQRRSRRSHRGTGPHPGARVEPLRHRARRSSGPDARSPARWRRSGLLLQLGRRGERGGAETGAQMGWAGQVPGDQRVRLVPRPHPCDVARDGPTPEARAVPAVARGLPARRVERPRGARACHRPFCRGGPARADSGRRAA